MISTPCSHTFAPQIRVGWAHPDPVITRPWRMFQIVIIMRMKTQGLIRKEEKFIIHVHSFKDIDMKLS